jgi:uncharacterized membrane protein
MLEHPEYSATECLGASIALMRGHRWDFFVLILSFILWSLVILIPVIGWLFFYCYVIPYSTATFANCHRFLLDEYEQKRNFYNTPESVN